MKTLCMDTSHRHLVLVLMEDGNVVASFQKECWKHQSETIFVELLRLMEEVKWSVDELERVVITKGPGSYTGIRIAMSVAKVLCTRKHIALYTLSTLQLYAGLNDTYVMLDARSKRAYFGDYTNGTKKKECILTLEEIESLLETNPKTLVGDTALLDRKQEAIDFVQHFVELEPLFEKVENIHALVPEYLKEDSAYMVK